MNRHSLIISILIGVTTNSAYAAERLELEIDLERDLISLSHNIENFIFSPTRNYPAAGETNINQLQAYTNLNNHLAATVLVRMNGDVIGYATEQEILGIDPETQHLIANSMWMLTLNHPDLKGFLVVKQREDGSGIFALVNQVLENPDRVWEDKWQILLSTIGEVRVQFASGDLLPYQDGVFEEYNGINQADYAAYHRFRGKIRFIVYPHTTR